MRTDHLATLRKIDETQLSADGQRALALVREELKSKVPKRTTADLRERILKIMKWALPALALTAGGVYTTEQAIDATRPALEMAMHREFGERKAEIQEAVNDLQSSAGNLLLKLLDFMIALKEKAGTVKGAAEMATGFWKGIWNGGRKDVKELVIEGDTSPDELIQGLKAIVSGDTQLSKKVTEIFTAYEDLKSKKDILENVGEEATKFGTKDAKEFWDDYKRSLWKEMSGRGAPFAK
ncbi:MAG: hypothetical protein WC897_03610 [Candidatus Gracilibacteria bacterium]